MYERFTDRARKVMQLANQEAQRFGHEKIDGPHILIGLLKEGSGVGANVLKNLDIDLGKLRAVVEKSLPPGGDPESLILGKLPHTDESKRIVECSVQAARDLNHNHVGTEHILLGAIAAGGKAAEVLAACAVTGEMVTEETRNLLGLNAEKEPKGETAAFAWWLSQVTGGWQAHPPGRVLGGRSPFVVFHDAKTGGAVAVRRSLIFGAVEGRDMTGREPSTLTEVRTPHGSFFVRESVTDALNLIDNNPTGGPAAPDPE